MAAADSGDGLNPETQNQNPDDGVFQGIKLDPSSPETDASRHGPFTDRSIAEALQNVDLEQTQNWNGKDKSGDECGGEGGSDGAKDQHPLRPYAEDCAYYIRTGMCKYGLFCRFNHPVKKRLIQGAEERSNDELVEQTFNTECKYYRTLSGCKFGEACRYRHEEQIKAPELNCLGLPKREGEIACHYYMLRGSCGYGAICKFHHPDPTDVVGSDSCNSSPTLNGSFVNHNGESDPSQQLGTSQLALALWPSHLDKPLSIVSMMDSISKEVDATYEWNESQEAAYPEEDPWQMNSLDEQQQIKLDEFPQRPGQPDCDYFLKTSDCKYGSVCRYHHPKTQFSNFPENSSSFKNLSPKPIPQEKAWKINSAIGVDIFMKKTDVSQYHQPKTEVEEFPVRPDEPECGYFLKTGDCMYRSACKYHHPKDRVSTLSLCALSDHGLPLRPDKTICWHYEQYGICKFGRSCLFDHPVDYCPLTSSYHSAYGGTMMTGSGAGSDILISQSV